MSLSSGWEMWPHAALGGMIPSFDGAQSPGWNFPIGMGNVENPMMPYPHDPSQGPYPAVPGPVVQGNLMQHLNHNQNNYHRNKILPLAVFSNNSRFLSQQKLTNNTKFKKIEIIFIIIKLFQISLPLINTLPHRFNHCKFKTIKNIQ